MSLLALAAAGTMAAGEVPATCDDWHPVAFAVLAGASDSMAWARVSKTRVVGTWSHTFAADGVGEFWVQPYAAIMGPLPKGRLKFAYDFSMSDDGLGHGFRPDRGERYLVRRMAGRWFVYADACVSGADGS